MKKIYHRLNLYKGFLVCFLLVINGLSCLLAQDIREYTFTPSSGTFTALSGATNPPLTAGTVVDGYYNTIPIGFDFWYMGIRYTSVSASTNGWLTLGAGITDTHKSNNLTSGGAPRPVIAPLWDDLNLQSTTNLSYLTTGSTGSRVFTLQYLNVKWNTTGGNKVDISMQVKLYEGSGKIEFIYNQGANTPTGVSASIGMAATATGAGNFLSLGGVGTNPTVSLTTETNTLNSRPAKGQIYAFLAPTPTAPDNLIFSEVGANSMTLNWTDNSTNETGFVIYRSTDNITYTFIEQTAANITSSIQSGLITSARYHWRVYAVSEGGLSLVLSGNQFTSCAAIPTLTDASRTGAGNVILSASGSTTDNYNWYSAPAGGASLATTATYTTPTLNFTTSYWVSTVNESGCESTPRMEVTATIHPLPTLTAPSSVCFQNSGIHLDGTDDYVDIPDATWFNGDFTVEAWVYVRGHNNWQRLLDFGNGEVNDNVFIALSRGTEGRVQFSTLNGSSGTDLISPSVVPLNEWVHVACVLNGTTGHMYVNGIRVASGTMNVPNNINRAFNYIGRSNWAADAYTNADVDELRIWNVARTESEIKANMHATIPESPTGLVANWPMDEGFGTSITDSKAGIAGVLINSPTWLNQGIIRATGHTGDFTLGLDGENDFMSVPEGIWFNGDFTVEGWVYIRTHAAWQRLFDFGNGAPSDNVYLALSNGSTGKPHFSIYNGTSYTDVIAPSALPLLQWVHVACVLSGTTGKIYVNGTEEVSGALNVPSNVSRTNNYIGRSNWAADAFANVLYDEIRIWDIARSKDQIQSYMNADVSSNSSGLQAYWKFNEGSGSSATNAASGALSTLKDGASWGFKSPLTTLSYGWSPSTDLNSTTGSSVTANPPSTTTYTITATNSQGGSSTTTVLFSVPTSTFTATDTVAINENASITYTGDAGPEATFTWDFDGGTISSGTGKGPYGVKWLSSGTKKITLTVTENACASSATTVFITVTSNAHYIWNGSSSNEWGNSSNWTPNGLPGTEDDITIESGDFSPAFDGTSGIKDLTMTMGILDLNGYTLTVSGVATFLGGSINNGTINLSCIEVTFEGTTFGAQVTAVCSDVALNGSAFNETSTIEKTGPSNNTSSGGNTFNASTSITNSGTGNLVLANVNPDTYNGNITFVQSNTGSLLPAYVGSNAFSGDITVNSPSIISFGAGGGTVICSGGNAQSISKSGTASPFFQQLTINKSANDLQLATAITVAGNLLLNTGNIISSTTNLLIFTDDATVTGASHSSYVNGSVRKIGNDAFTFPIGKEGFYRPAAISAPSTLTDHFTAEYFAANADLLYTHSSKDAGIDHLSQCEYWTIDRTNGSPEVDVTLSWDTNSCGISHPSELLVARWDGLNWKDHGNGGTSGDAAKGTVRSATAITSFSPFTLASMTENNPLPIVLEYFTAAIARDWVTLSWATASEKENDFFTLEKSTDGINFQEITRRNSAGSPHSKTYYTVSDYNPYPGISYYRLKQTDINGDFEYSKLLQVTVPYAEAVFTISPNPFIGSFKLIFQDRVPTGAIVHLFDVGGRLLFTKALQNEEGNKEVNIQMEQYSSGFYYLKLFYNNKVTEKAIIKIR